MEMSAQHHAPAVLALGREPRYRLNGRLSGPSSRSGRLTEEKIRLALSEFEPRIAHPLA